MNADAGDLQGVPAGAAPPVLARAEAVPSAAVARASARAPTPKARRAFWLKQLHLWHWISSAVALVSLVLFSATGITLNHAASIEGRPRTTTREARLPADRLALLAGEAGRRPLPAPVAEWIRAETGVATAGREAEWGPREVYVALPRPGGDAWLTVDRASGEIVHEQTSRGWVSYLNDLHKGRHTGPAWSLVIDAVAVACLLSAATGLVLLQLHARHRPLTWPMVALGIAAPLLVAILLIH